jgi:hypothetical protein
MGTDFGGALDFSPIDPLGDAHRSYTNKYDTYLLRRFRDRMVTKVALVLVCRLWRSLASRLLYECVTVYSTAQWCKLSATLDRHLRESTKAHSTAESTMPWVFTRRLNISSVPVCLSQYFIWADFSRVVRSFKSVKILSLMSDPENILPLFVTPNGIDGLSLQQVNWNASTSHSLQKFIELAPLIGNLEVLMLETKGVLNPLAVVEDCGVEFPRLHTLCLTGRPVTALLKLVAEWKLPVLTRLHIRDWSYMEAPNIYYSHVFRSHGSSLLFVSLDARFEFDIAIELCPFLRHAILPFPTRLRTQTLSSHSKLSRISIATKFLTSWGARKRSIVRIVDPDLSYFLLDTLRSRPVSLESVRLLSWSSGEYTDPWDEESVSSWCAIVARYRDAGVRLEDGSSELITIPDLVSPTSWLLSNRSSSQP